MGTGLRGRRFQERFQVEVLPEGADPMDIRYNMIHWVHRDSRGWSYGDRWSIRAPARSSRARSRWARVPRAPRLHDRRGAALALRRRQAHPQGHEEMVLARTRQLAAHEVGHTLGLVHNFAASSVAPGTSVMDYPTPGSRSTPTANPISPMPTPLASAPGTSRRSSMAIRTSVRHRRSCGARRSCSTTKPPAFAT